LNNNHKNKEQKPFIMGTSNESKSHSEIHCLQEFVSQELFGGVSREVQDVEAGGSYRQPFTVRAASIHWMKIFIYLNGALHITILIFLVG